MEIDKPGESNQRNTGVKENRCHLFPVSPNDSGEGLPYAPVDWPNPGDKWLWRVGNRIAASGFFRDRYLYLPRKKKRFSSKPLVEEYIQKISPDVDVDAFFASFSWKIPSKEKHGLKGDVSIEINKSGESNGGNAGVNENGSYIFPVSANDSGEGLPYAPVDWPNPGDKWLWRVGNRITASGFFVDRYLYLPNSLLRFKGKRKRFASKPSVEEYIQRIFPDADIDAFFASFSWKIPAKDERGLKGVGRKEEFQQVIVSSKEIAVQSEPDFQVESEVCKAKNKFCASLLEPETYSLQPMACDICCSKPGFCRDCCCILCHKHVSYAYGGYSFIKCEAAMGEGTICGHIAHIDCALRCDMAGTVGSTIGLDAEYFCSRCESITDFIPHVTKLLQTCESIECRKDVEKVLNVGSCILRCSQKTSAKKLLPRVELAMAKLKDAACLLDIWKMEDVSSVKSGRLRDHLIDEIETENYQESLAFGTGSPRVLSGNFDPRIESFKLEDEVDQILLALRNAQKSEFRIADDALHAQKNCILNLYRQLEYKRLKVYASTTLESYEHLLEVDRETEDQIKREVKKLRDMKQVTKGFGMTSKDVLEEHFGLKIDK